MKRILLFLCAIFFTANVFATGIGANDTTASCDNNTLGQTSGTSNMEIDWQPNTINIRWYDGETQLNVQSSAQSCVYNDDLYLPTTRPTKIGYTFKGWTVIDVPAGYTKLEYLESTGTQWIDMGIKLDSTDKVQVIGMGTGTHSTTSAYFFGAYDINTGFGLNYGYARNIYPVWESTSAISLNDILSLNTKYIFELSSDGLYIDGTKKRAVSGNFIGTQNAYLFYASNTSHSPLIGRIYSAKIWKTGVLDRNFIPVKRNSDDVLGMYDTVTGNFFTNAGTGTFVAGPVVLPSGYTRLEYLESTGNGQYIDTGINTWNNTIEYEIKLSIEHQDTGTHTYFGAYDIWNSSGHNLSPISTYYDYRFPATFQAGLSSSAGVDIGIRSGQTGVISLKGNTVSWSEGSHASFDRDSTFTVSNINIFLFADGVNGRIPAEYAKTKMYYAKFWLDGSLVRNFIPARRNNDGVLGMYDTVSQTFKTNGGSGTFIAGPVVQ